MPRFITLSELLFLLDSGEVQGRRLPNGQIQIDSNSLTAYLEGDPPFISGTSKPGISIEEFARDLSYHPNTIKAWIKDGTLRRGQEFIQVKKGGAIRIIYARAIERLLEVSRDDRRVEDDQKQPTKKPSRRASSRMPRIRLD